MKRLLFLIFFFLIIYTTSYSFDSPISTSNTYFAFLNDAFGYTKPGEWDDLRSFGLQSDIEYNKWVLSLSYYSLTDRAINLRNDEFNITTKYNITDFFSGYLGLTGIGNFEGLVLQEGFHSNISNIVRSVPVDYESYSNFAIFAGSKLNLDFSYGNGSLDFCIDSFKRINATISFFTKGNLAFGIIYNNSTQKPLVVGRVITDTQQMESGLWLATVYQAGIFKFVTGYNCLTNISTGSIEFTKSYKGTVTDSSIEFGIPIGKNQYLVRYLTPLDSNFYWFFERDSGWATSANESYSQGIANRFTTWSLGLEYNWEIFPNLIFYGALSTGIQDYSIHNQTLQNAQSLSDSINFSLIPEIGIKWYLYHTKNIAYGISIAESIQIANSVEFQTDIRFLINQR